MMLPSPAGPPESPRRGAGGSGCGRGGQKLGQGVRRLGSGGAEPGVGPCRPPRPSPAIARGPATRQKSSAADFGQALEGLGSLG